MAAARDQRDRDRLPPRWSYGVRRDGRVFFISEETRTTTWLHPGSGEAVSSGHVTRSDLPRGWEEAFTEQGAAYFLDHNQRTASFRHPVTGQVAPENLDFLLQEPPGPPMMSRAAAEQLSTSVSEASTSITSSTVDPSKASRSGGKVHSFGKREQAIKRNPNVPAVVRGWLYKQDSSGMRLWKRKWFVLADFCLFYYKDSREESVLGSIPLPSYVVAPVGPEDHISRKFAFKAEHPGMRTYYFSADTQDDMSSWLGAMNRAALVQDRADRAGRAGRPADSLRLVQQAVPQTNHLQTRPVHEVLLEPLHRDPEELCSCLTEPSENDPRTSQPSNPAAPPPSGEHASASAPVSRAPSRPASTLPTRNGLVSTPSPILEPNGIAAGTYQRVPEPAGPDRMEWRRSTLDQVEQWVQVQKAEHRGPPSRENTLPRRTPPTQHRYTTLDAYQTLPRPLRQSPPPGRLGEYKYAQDRLSHFRLGPDQGGPGGPGGPGGAGPVWQLYEWQQRHQFRHGSPTAPLYTPAPEYPFGPRPPSTGPPRSEGGPPRCVSVPPSSADVPPPGSSRTLSPTRRPHTPAGRVTVRPGGTGGAGALLDAPFTVSPRRTKSQMLKAATIERRSMPPSGYITHTVSAPSLHGKTADDTYLQLKKDLQYLDLKVVGGQTLKDSGKPVKVAESDVDVKLSRLCEQDKILKELEATISSLKDDKDQLERILDVSHQQMEQYQDQPAHLSKISYQQRLLQEDLVSIRAQISRRSTEMTKAWQEYGGLEASLEQLRAALQAHVSRGATAQDKADLKRELWRIEDVMAGLSASKSNYKVTIDSVQNPERKLVPSVSDPGGSSPGAEVQPPPRTTAPQRSQTLPRSTVPKWAEEDAPPRPPLPRLYDAEDTPPAVPPLPREASAVRHTSVRGLKRQSDGRRRDREPGPYVANGDCKADLRSYLSEPELPGVSADAVDFHFYPKGAASQLHQSSSIASYVTLRRRGGGSAAKERPRSALERLASPPEAPPPAGAPPRGRMTAEEQLQRMKRHQRALVRERKRNLSQGDRSGSGVAAATHRSASSPRLPCGAADPPSSVFDWQEERPGAEGQSDEGLDRVWDRDAERRRTSSDGWLKVTATRVQEVDLDPLDLDPLDLDPLDYDLDISRELSKPRKVSIPERYVESDPEEPAGPEELEQRSRVAERIKTLLAKSSVQNRGPAPLDLGDLDSALQQQQKIMSVSQALASEASRKSKMVAAKAAAGP
ncbi:pleckstrin homology domain-containing family A member 7-like isoform X3 [Cololabis saira]|uniref:pleckstrin homology domain-containing family A member 7-like isoform X3 n=1 Tax=Cololabis saira TaxID=129043 RepID=UPI002AD22C6C|nr:pleckstrin homology domain-containing family A member 7-like isoform X3 [Cololabis saira]